METFEFSIAILYIMSQIKFNFVRSVKPRAYAVPEEPNRDPVHLYKLYADKRPVEMRGDDSPFFLTPCNSTQLGWFRRSAIGINKLYGIMAEMKADAGITEPRITPYR